MNDISSLACLGPEGTYSSKAARFYLNDLKLLTELKYFDDIAREIHDNSENCSHFIIAVENSSEGFITRNLKAIARSTSYVVGEITIPISFSFVANTSELRDIENIYVHAVAQGQVKNFLERCPNAQINYSHSNVDAFERFKSASGSQKCGAVVPCGIDKEDSQFHWVHAINDNDNNSTRFLVLQQSSGKPPSAKDEVNKVFIIIPDATPQRMASAFLWIKRLRFDVVNTFPIPKDNAIGTYDYYVELTSARLRCINDVCSSSARFPVRIVGALRL